MIKITTKILAAALLVNSHGLLADNHGSAEMLVNTCVACHGPGGNSVGPATPNLAGLSPVYFMGAMLAYKYSDADKLEEVIDADEDFADVEVFPRFSTIMNRIAPGYTEDQIKQMAAYFSEQEPQRPKQEFDAELAAVGAKLHEAHCDKCHEDEGRSAEDDTGVLAGQWKPYMLYTLNDFQSGAREMPKKMRKQMEDAHERVGDSVLEKLANYYASITD